MLSIPIPFLLNPPIWFGLTFLMTQMAVPPLRRIFLNVFQSSHRYKDDWLLNLKIATLHTPTPTDSLTNSPLQNVYPFSFLCRMHNLTPNHILKVKAIDLNLSRKSLKFKIFIGFKDGGS